MDEYNMVKRALQNETFPNKNRKSNKKFLSFEELSYSDQVIQIKKRLTDYSKKVYHRVKTSEVVEREAIICQRENPFYIDTVRSFRDRRYEFKGLAKTWKKNLSDIDPEDKHERDEAKKMIILYDSLQLAHKVILNSFYGYVMRKGSRWYSMEMAGITCLTGATIIQVARSLVERIGRPLELDTDGIWCIIPKSFPDNFIFTLTNGKKLFLSYPCSMLNYRVHCRFTNHQYQTLVDPIKHKYQTHSDNSIFFEVDGPYKAMVLPTSKEEGKGIKKRYAVFNEDGSLAELKGFELKRRGELQLIKNFQSDLFKVFLEGNTLEACYAAVAAVANRWLDVLDTRGSMLEDEDLIALICENRSMSKTLKEYEGQKSTSITTARRLGEFLGEEMIKDKGLQCKYIISSKPLNAPVTERAIPVAIFSADLSVKRSFLRRWLVDSSLENFDPRAIIDWDYYRERLASVVQKIITIPAALQNIKNPVPRVDHPDWLQKRIAVSEDKFKQSSLTNFFKKTTHVPVVKDIEDNFADSASIDNSPKIRVAKVTSRKISKRRRAREYEEESLVLPTEMPSMDEDYVGWLSYQKIKWRIQARDRKRRTQLFGNSGNVSHRTPLGNILRKHAELYANSTWEILEYKETSEPGILDVYVLVNRKVHMLKFKMSRSIYINFKTNTLPEGTIDNCLVEKSSGILPNNRSLNKQKSNSLFKLTLPEEIYLDELQNPSSVLNNESVLGVFESSVTPLEKAIMELGSSVGFSSNTVGALGKGLQKGFDSKNLYMEDGGRYLEKFYLEPAYLLHLSTSIGYEFFVLYKSWAKNVEVFVLKPSENAQSINASMLEAAYQDSYSKKTDKLNKYYDLIKFPDNIDSEHRSFTDLAKLYRKLSSSIAKLNDEKGSQVIMLLQSPFAKKLRKNIKPFLQMPLVEMSMGETQLPQLKWQNILINLIVGHILSLGTWLHNLIALSRYSNIPLCNLKLEKMGYVIDIMYARNLKKQNIILWWSGTNPLPDHGGVEKDFNPSMASLMTDLEAQVFNNPEIYDSVVLEIEVNNLTVNTVLSSALINEAEGSDLAEMAITSNNDDDGNANSMAFIEDSFSGASLSVLRALLKSMWDDALMNNLTADSLVHTFINWVHSPDSKLFDHSLRYHVHNLTKKALLQLINVCKCLGSSIVFADRNKIFLKTSKTTVENSYAYGQYLIKAVRTTPMFHFLDLSICRYWDLLIWMDNYNFGGRACTRIEEREEQVLEAYSKWHIKNFLPPIYQQEFDDWMIIILDSIIKVKESFFESNSGTQRLTQLPPNKSTSSNVEDEDSDALTGFTMRFSQPMVKRIAKLLKNQQEYILDPNFSADYAFPVLPGSHLKMKNPLLELVKDLCHIMMLSKKRTLEARGLRKNLLKIFEIEEFDWESEFRDPSSSLVVNNLICEHCSFINDLDFCKRCAENIFQCDRCQKPYNSTLLQEHLIQTLQTELETYFMQDLKCDKCGRIKEDLMSDYCICSGRWKACVSKDGLASKIEIFKSVAAYYNFELLASVIEELF